MTERSGVNPRFLKAAEEFGGSDIKDWSDYTIEDEERYCNKPDHFSRSLHHQPNHSRRMRKIFEKKGESL